MDSKISTSPRRSLLICSWCGLEIPRRLWESYIFYKETLNASLNFFFFPCLIITLHTDSANHKQIRSPVFAMQRMWHTQYTQWKVMSLSGDISRGEVTEDGLLIISVDDFVKPATVVSFKPLRYLP